MHIYHLSQWQHAHNFSIDNTENERNTWRVILFTVIMMAIEIIAGIVYGSMALLADGWHMGTHAVALGITVFTYFYARRHANDPRYSFGTGKVSDLGGFASAIVLLVVAFLMAAESVQRLFSPVEIQFTEAIGVAFLGLVVNLVSAWLLQGDHHHDHHDHHHDHHHQQDHNLQAAYLHVLADAMTSVLAIVALFAGKAFGWIWLDALMGIVGAIVITVWSYGLLRDTSRILLDSGVEPEILSEIRTTIEEDADNRVTDLHVWQVGVEHFAAVLSLVTHYPKPVEHYKNLLRDFKKLHHVTVEVNHCTSEPCLVPNKTNAGAKKTH